MIYFANRDIFVYLFVCVNEWINTYIWTAYYAYDKNWDHHLKQLKTDSTKFYKI